MEIIQKKEDIIALKNNKFFVKGGSVDITNSKIVFQGNNNIVFIYNSSESVVQFLNTTVYFFGSNSLLFIDAGKARYTFDLHIFHNSVCHIGANNYFNPHGETIRLRCAEEKNIFIGDDGMFSSNIEIYTSDSHLIFDCSNLKRINYAKSVYIGDHVWLGRMSNILKGSQIGSGSIIGTRGVLTKKVPSNTSWAGSPAKQIAAGVFFVGYNAQTYQKNDIELHSMYQSDRWIYTEGDETINFEQIEDNLNKFTDPIDKAYYLTELAKYKRKNRFFIA